MKKLVKESLNEKEVQKIQKNPRDFAIQMQQLCKSYQETLTKQELYKIILSIADIYK
jgi:uncharacterized protein YsxB (DUF464 family)